MVTVFLHPGGRDRQVKPEPPPAPPRVVVHLTPDVAEALEKLRAELVGFITDREILLDALKVTRGNLRSLGPAGAIGPYDVWRRIVDDAIESVEPSRSRRLGIHK